jgi:spermidine/putrescine-binding protein
MNKLLEEENFGKINSIRNTVQNEITKLVGDSFRNLNNKRKGKTRRGYPEIGVNRLIWIIAKFLSLYPAMRISAGRAVDFIDELLKQKWWYNGDKTYKGRSNAVK